MFQRKSPIWKSRPWRTSPYHLHTIPVPEACDRGISERPWLWPSLLKTSSFTFPSTLCSRELKSRLEFHLGSRHRQVLKKSNLWQLCLVNLYHCIPAETSYCLQINSMKRNSLKPRLPTDFFFFRIRWLANKVEYDSTRPDTRAELLKIGNICICSVFFALLFSCSFPSPGWRDTLALQTRSNDLNVDRHLILPIPAIRLPIQLFIRPKCGVLSANLTFTPWRLRSTDIDMEHRQD